MFLVYVYENRTLLCRLAELVDEIDLILGGHDHVYEKKMVRKSKDKSKRLQSILPT